MTWKIIQIQGRNMSDSTRKNHSSDHVLFNVSGAVRGKTGKLSVLGAVHKRRRQLGGRGQKLVWFYPHIINTGTQVPIVTQSSMEYLESTTLGLTYPLAPEGAFFIGKSKSTNNVVPCIINTFWNTIRPISSICCSKITRNKTYSPKYTFLHYKSFLQKAKTTMSLESLVVTNLNKDHKQALWS